MPNGPPSPLSCQCTTHEMTVVSRQRTAGINGPPPPCDLAAHNPRSSRPHERIASGGRRLSYPDDAGNATSGRGDSPVAASPPPTRRVCLATHGVEDRRHRVDRGGSVLAFTVGRGKMAHAVKLRRFSPQHVPSHERSDDDTANGSTCSSGHRVRSCIPVRPGLGGRVPTSSRSISNGRSN